MQGTLFVVTGPSGVGKTAVVERVLPLIPNAHRLVTCTTRGLREGEIDGVDYNFLTRDVFQGLIDRGEMVEWDEHYGNLYGIRKADVERHLAEGGPTFIWIDTEGAKTLKALWPEAVVIFLTAESKEVLESRIRSRGTTSEADVQIRLDRLPSELAYEEKADYVVENAEGKLEETVSKISQIIQQELAKS